MGFSPYGSTWVQYWSRAGTGGDLSCMGIMGKTVMLMVYVITSEHGQLNSVETYWLSQSERQMLHMHFALPYVERG